MSIWIYIETREEKGETSYVVGLQTRDKLLCRDACCHYLYCSVYIYMFSMLWQWPYI